MSSLIYFTDAENAVVATDTLAVTISDKTPSPSAFTSKAIIVPHLRMIIAGTGCMGFSTRWFARVNDNMVVSGIDHLDYFAQENLRVLWATYLEELSIPPDIATSTIYHFGFSKEKEVIHSYAYRSTNNFKSEPLRYGVFTKPEAEPLDTPFTLASIKPMMDSQRSIQATKPEKERLYIGGEIQLIVLSKDGFRALTLDKFDDYHSDEEQIYANFK